jgi:hypothetical protein
MSAGWLLLESKGIVSKLSIFNTAGEDESASDRESTIIRPFCFPKPLDGYLQLRNFHLR